MVPETMRLSLRHALALLVLAAGLAPFTYAQEQDVPVDLSTQPRAVAQPAQVAPPPSAASPAEPTAPRSLGSVAATRRASEARLSTGAAITLGLVEGITEFLPISSTGHLIIANALLGLEDDTPLVDDEGRPLYHKKPSAQNPEGERLTVKLAADTYAVIIQVGAIAAVALLYWRRIKSCCLGVIGRDREGLQLTRNLICAVVPVAIIGLLCNKWIDEHLFSVQAVIVAQISGAVLMIYAERWRRERSATHQSAKPASELSVVESLSVGGIQCLALWPGTSRSMVTIVGGYFAGLSPAKAAEFSFLVGLPVLAGAALVKGLKSGAAMIDVFGIDHVVLGIVVAAISAAIAVKSLVAFLSRYGLFAFAMYRLGLATLLAFWFFTH